MSDFMNVNKILKRPGYPMEGSGQIMKRLEPNKSFFATLDLSSGYHQSEIAEESRDYFAMILPQGKFSFTELSQGISPAIDIFNLVKDWGNRNQQGYFKNIDDVLTSGGTIETLEHRLSRVLDICTAKNMKVIPPKFKVSQEVTFWGCKISGNTLSNGTRKTFIDRAQEKVEN